MEDHEHCPICFETPLREIYQCVNGHTICSDCITNIKSCPQCRIPYGHTKIRNRALEQILCEKTFSCNFKRGGCQLQFTREDLAKHMPNCYYNPSSKTAGRLCQQIGFKDCECILQSSDRAKIIKHFRDDHEIPVQTGSSLTIQHGDFISVSAATSNRIWKPVLMCLDDKPGWGQGPLILILAKLTSMQTLRAGLASVYGKPLYTLQKSTEFSLHYSRMEMEAG